MRSERWLKNLAKIAVGLVLLIVAGGALLYFEFSSWAKSHQDLKFHVATTSGTTQAAEPTPSPTPTEATEQVQARPQAAPVRMAPAPLDAPTTYLVDRFANNGAQIEVCRMLSNQPTPAHKAPALGQASTDPAMEAVFLPIAHFLELPAVQRLAVTIANARQAGDASALVAPDFRQQVDAAAAEVTTHQQELNTASQAAYNLFALSRAVEMVPQMGTDNEVQDFCSHQQDLATGSGSQSQDQVGEDKSRLFRILSKAGLGPEDVEYDASQTGQAMAEANIQGLRFSASWEGVVGGGGFQLGNPLATPPATVSGATSGPKD